MLFVAKISVDCVNYATKCLHAFFLKILSEIIYAAISIVLVVYYQILKKFIIRLKMSNNRVFKLKYHKMCFIIRRRP